MGAHAAREHWTARDDASLRPQPAVHEPDVPTRVQERALDPRALMALQRSAGNHAVCELLAGRTATPASRSRLDPDSSYQPKDDVSSSALVQRIGPEAIVGQIGGAIRSAVTGVTGVLTPQDNFAGRSLRTFGVGEVIDLSFTAPQTAAQYGGLQWVIGSGGGAIVSANDGTGTYTAPGDPATVTLKLQVAAGANVGDVKATKTFEVVGIESARMVRDTGKGIWHRNGTASVGFKGKIFFGPKSVSFQWATMQEGTAPGKATGFLDAHGKNGENHAATGFGVAIGAGDSAQGSELTGTDTVATGVYGKLPDKNNNPAFWKGTFTWDIPWYYQGPGGTLTKFTTATHSEEVDSSGTASIKKKGAGPEKKTATAADSDY